MAKHTPKHASLKINSEDDYLKSDKERHQTWKVTSSYQLNLLESDDLGKMAEHALKRIFVNGQHLERVAATVKEEVAQSYMIDKANSAYASFVDKTHRMVAMQLYLPRIIEHEPTELEISIIHSPENESKD